MARKSKTNKGGDDFVVGGGNDLKERGYSDPVETRAKFFLANQIAIAVEEMGLSQSAAAEMTGLKQPDVSRIVNGNVKEYSIWRLTTTLAALGFDIAIDLRRLPEGKGLSRPETSRTRGLLSRSLEMFDSA